MESQVLRLRQKGQNFEMRDPHRDCRNRICSDFMPFVTPHRRRANRKA